jgi:ankyrin repeat protein
MKENANGDLLQAALMNDRQACLDALEGGALINVQDAGGDTALHIAASWGYAEISHLLLENGASMLVRNNFILTPLHIAAINGHTQTVALLLDWAGKGKEYIPRDMLDEVIYVCSKSKSNDRKILEILRDFDSRKAEHKTVRNKKADANLLEACMSGDSEKAKNALSNKAVPDARDDDGTTALRLACRKGYADIARLLLENGALVNKRSKTGWTPLMEACAEGYIGIVSILLENGALVNAKTYVHATALILAARGGYLEIVRMLLDHGADPSIRITSPASDAGKDAIKVAIENDHGEIALLVRDYIREV